MSVHPDKTAYRAVDACGGTYTPEQYANGYAEGHAAALDEAMEAVKKPDALMAELFAALKGLIEAETVTHHVGYDSSPGGGAAVYEDAVLLSDDAFGLARATIAKASAQ